MKQNGFHEKNAIGIVGWEQRKTCRRFSLSDDMSIVRACVHVCMRASAAYQTKTQVHGGPLTTSNLIHKNVVVIAGTRCI